MTRHQISDIYLVLKAIESDADYSR